MLPLSSSPWYNCDGWLGVKHQVIHFRLQILQIPCIPSVLFLFLDITGTMNTLWTVSFFRYKDTMNTLLFLFLDITNTTNTLYLVSVFRYKYLENPLYCFCFQISQIPLIPYILFLFLDVTNTMNTFYLVFVFRYRKYRLRCSSCWHIPRKDNKVFPACSQCGGVLRFSQTRKCWTEQANL